MFNNLFGPKFTDVGPDHWAYSTLNRAAFYGIAKGYPDGTFQPDQPVTRVEAAVFSTRALDRALIVSGVTLAATLMVAFMDNKGRRRTA